MVRTQGVSTPLLAAGALDRYVLQSPGGLDPLLRLDTFSSKRRGSFRTEGETHPPTGMLSGLAAEPSELDNQNANDPP